MTILNPVTIVNTDSSPINVVLANVSELVNAQTGTTYTVLSTDWGKLVTYSNGSSIAVTLPEAGSAGFAAGWNANMVNLGVGTVTITPTTSTINGAATLTLTTGQGVQITSDGTNYVANIGMGGTALNPTELGYLDGVTPGTATASKALVIGASKEIATITTATITNLTTTTLTPTTIAGGTFSTMFRIPSATVAATGTVQGDAALIATGFTLVSGADGATGVLLPAAAAGLVCLVKNGAAAVLKIWPSTGDAINALGANNSFSIAANTSLVLVSYDATTWYSIPLLPS